MLSMGTSLGKTADAKIKKKFVERAKKKLENHDKVIDVAEAAVTRFRKKRGSLTDQKVERVNSGQDDVDVSRRIDDLHSWCDITRSTTSSQDSKDPSSRGR
eukprot:jgi/Mesvir1/1482/Mv14465-RA.1